MKKIVFLILLMLNSLYCSEFKRPTKTLISSGYVIDLLYKDSKLYAATDAGVLDIYDYKTKKIIKQIKVPMVKDFMGDDINSKIFSVDESNGDIMLLSKSKGGFNRIHIHKNNKNNLIIDSDQSLAIIKAKYLNHNTLILALLSNEIISYDIKNNKQNYRIQVNGAKFSDFALSEDKKSIAITDESGDVTIFDTDTGTQTHLLTGQNLDNIFQISYKNGVIATAGQDRRVAVYVPAFKSSYHLKSNFLVYGVGLSPKGKLLAYASDEKNNITVINSITKSVIAKFGNNISTVSDIEFVDENSFFVSTNSKNINLYKMK